MTPFTALPKDADHALLIGRLWQPGTGPVLCLVTPTETFDLSPLALTCASLLALDTPASAVHAARAAAGVTFVASLLARVIEEHSRGDALRAQAVRQSIYTKWWVTTCALCAGRCRRVADLGIV